MTDVDISSMSMSIEIHIKISINKYINLFLNYFLSVSSLSKALSKVFFGHWLLFHSSPVPDHFQRDVFEHLTVTSDSLKHKKVPNSRNEALFSRHITDN